MMHRQRAHGMARWARHLRTDEHALALKAQRGVIGAYLKRWRRATRGHGLAERAMRHALHRDLARGWHCWRSRQAVSAQELERRATAFFAAHATVRGFHAWIEQKREEDQAMLLTFASAASILPIASAAKNELDFVRAAALLPLASIVAEAQAAEAGAPTGSESSGELTPGADGKKKAKKAPARPRMVFH
jgi:hypothetical protein